MSQWRSFCIRKVRSQSPHEELHYKSWINVIVFSDLIFLRFILNCVRGWGRHTTWLRVLLTSLRTTMATNRLSKSLERLERRTPASVNFLGGIKYILPLYQVYWLLTIKVNLIFFASGWTRDLYRCWPSNNNKREMRAHTQQGGFRSRDLRLGLIS